MERAALLYEESASLLAGAGLQDNPLWARVQQGLVGTYAALGDPARAAEQGQVVTDAEVVPLVRVRARYPFFAKRNNVQGDVVLELTIAPDGSVEDARVVESFPPGTFDASALASVRQWKFAPQFVDGQPVRRTGARVTVGFRLVTVKP